MKGLIATYLLTYGGAAASLFDPYYGLLVYFSFSIIRPEAMWHWSVPAGNYSKIVAIALLIGWALRGFGGFRFGRNGLAMTLTAFFCWCVLSALSASVADSLSWGYLDSLSKILLPVLVGCTVINTMKRVWQTAWVLMLSQAYVAFEMNVSYFEGFNRLSDYGFGGMDNNCMGIALVTATAMTYFMAAESRKMTVKLIGAIACVLMLHAILFSFSRGALLALILTGGLAFLLIRKTVWHLVAMAAAIGVGIRLAGKEVLERFSTTFADASSRDESAQSRLDLWADCWDLMQKRPIFGAGPDNWPLYARDIYGWGVPKEAHSLWMQTGAETGFIGLALLLGYYFLAVKIALPWALYDRREYGALGRGITCGLFGFGVSAMMVSLEGLEMPYYIAMLAAVTREIQRKGAPRISDAAKLTQLRTRPGTMLQHSAP